MTDRFEPAPTLFDRHQVAERELTSKEQTEAEARAWMREHPRKLDEMRDIIAEGLPNALDGTLSIAWVFSQHRHFVTGSTPPNSYQPYVSRRLCALDPSLESVLRPKRVTG